MDPSDIVPLFSNGVTAACLAYPAKRVWEHILANDPAGTTLKVLRRTVERLGGEQPTAAIEPGLLLDVGRSAAIIDDENMQEMWASLLHQALVGDLADSDARWACGVLSRLVPADALVLAILADRRLRFNSGPPDVVVGAIDRLQAASLLELKTSSTAVAKLVAAAGDTGPRGCLVGVLRFASGPAPQEHTWKEMAVADDRWLLTSLGVRFCSHVEVPPLTNFAGVEHGFRVLEWPLVRRMSAGHE